MDLPERLKETVCILSGEIGPRDYRRPHALERTAEFISSELERSGYEVSFQDYSADGRVFRNIQAEVRGRVSPEKILIVGAHYDTVENSPGADDNASWVAGLLALAALFQGSRLEKTVRFVAFTLEEPPFFRSRNMGSYVYAGSLSEKAEQIEGMICLEMIGFYSDVAGGQLYPLSSLRWFYPDRGNFIGLVSNLRSRDFLQRVKKAFMRGTDLRVESISTTPLMPGVDFSDHRSFWEFGYRALMVTDTSFYRNPYYHEPGDTHETLDYARMAEVVSGLRSAIEAVAVETG